MLSKDSREWRLSPTFVYIYIYVYTFKIAHPFLPPKQPKGIKKKRLVRYWSVVLGVLKWQSNWTSECLALVCICICVRVRVRGLDPNCISFLEAAGPAHWSDVLMSPLSRPCATNWQPQKWVSMGWVSSSESHELWLHSHREIPSVSPSRLHLF